MTVSDYEDLISSLVKKFMTVVKKETIIEAANAIEGLQVNDSGDVVSLTRPGSVVFEEIYQKYKSMGGGVARIFAKQAIKQIIESNPGLTIPDELR
jgi:ribosomal protein L17